MKQITTLFFVMLAILFVGVTANADEKKAVLPVLPELPTHEEFLKGLVEEGRMTAEEAKADLELSRKSEIMLKESIPSPPENEASEPAVDEENIVDVPTSEASESATIDEVEEDNTDLAVGTIFAPAPVKRKIAGTNRHITSITPVYVLHDGEYLIPLNPRTILNGVITKNGYYYTVIGVEKNFFKLLFEKKCTSAEIQEILGGKHPPFQAR